MTKLMQFLHPLPDFPDSPIFHVELKGHIWHLSAPDNADCHVKLIDARVLRQVYGLVNYVWPVPDEPLRAMATSARQAQVFVVVRSMSPWNSHYPRTLTVDLAHPIVANGATLHAFPITIEGFGAHEKVKLPS